MKLVGKTKEQVEQDRLKRLADQVRAERNRKLAETDWMVLPDAPIRQAEREAVLQYRQALRDIPQQRGFPEVIIWPNITIDTLEKLSKESQGGRE
jgi:predicted transposase YdaD